MKYTAPEMEMLEVSTEDIVLASGEVTGPIETPDFDE